MLFSFAQVSPAEAVGSPPTYYPFGPQANVPESSLVGWQLCYRAFYNTFSPSLATIQTACNGDYLLLAGRPVGSTTFTVVAAGPRADVLFDTGGSSSSTRNVPHNANGTGWYYNASWSWGYAKAGDPINRVSCDVESINGTLRLCWHTGNGNINGGYRAGTTAGLNSSTAWERFIYQPVAVVDTIAPTASPTQSPAANGAGWNNSNVTVTWHWTDNAGGSGINPATCVTSSGTSSEGNPLTLNAICQDLTGNTGSASYNVMVDKTNPTISGSHSPAANASGWNNSDVTVSFTCSDALSGLAAGSPPTNTVLSGEGASLSAMGTCLDVASNSASDTQSEIKIDKTAPNTGITAPSGWNNTDVTLTLTPNDGLSGVSATNFVLDGGAAQTGTSIVISTEGLHTVEYWSEDNAGNAETHHSAEVKIDKAAPTISHTQLPDANDNGWNNSDVTVTFVCGDSLSGIASCTDPQTVTTEGQLQAVTGIAVDNAGNSATDPATVSIDKGSSTISASADRVPNADGWYNDDVLISFTCADTLSGLENIANSGIANCPPAQTLGEGANQSASDTATDAAGNASASATVSGINVDKTAPSISAAATTAPNGAGWYNGDVTIHFTCTDAGSGIPAGTCPADQVLSAEGEAVASIAQTVTDVAGNTSNPSNVVSVQIDKTAPTISAAATTSPNAAGWYNSNVTVQFTCTDALSGILTGVCPTNQTLSAEGTAVASSAQTVTDAAGNTSDASNVVTVQIDKTAPTLNPVVSPNSVILNGTATVTSGAADTLSGLDTQSCGALVTNTIGPKSVTCSAMDKAGNSFSKSASYNVNYRFDGFLQPINDTAHTTYCGNPCVASIFKGGSTVPVKFQLKDANGVVVQSASLPVWLTPVKGGFTSAAIDESTFSDLATSGTTYRFDSTGPQYIYNWGTKGFTTGFFWRIGVTLDDGQTYYVYIGLR